MVLLGLVGGANGMNLETPGVEHLGETIDDGSLAGRVPPFEHYHDGHPLRARGTLTLPETKPHFRKDLLVGLPGDLLVEIEQFKHGCVLADRRVSAGPFARQVAMLDAPPPRIKRVIPEGGCRSVASTAAGTPRRCLGARLQRSARQTRPLATAGDYAKAVPGLSPGHDITTNTFCPTAAA